jgi:uncharacterized BrkB/YihY/UPF0761 family membrane protein
MTHLTFAVVLLMLAGYLFMELARYSRARQVTDPALDYPAIRLLLRVINGGLLVFLLWILLYAETPYGREPVTRYLMPAALVTLLVLLVVDLRSVRRQFQREARRREDQFLRELERAVRDSERRTAAGNGR